MHISAELWSLSQVGTAGQVVDSGTQRPSLHGTMWGPDIRSLRSFQHCSHSVSPTIVSTTAGDPPRQLNLRAGSAQPQETATKRAASLLNAASSSSFAFPVASGSSSIRALNSSQRSLSGVCSVRSVIFCGSTLREVASSSSLEPARISVAAALTYFNVACSLAISALALASSVSTAAGVAVGAAAALCNLSSWSFGWSRSASVTVCSSSGSAHSSSPSSVSTDSWLSTVSILSDSRAGTSATSAALIAARSSCLPEASWLFTSTSLGSPQIASTIAICLVRSFALAVVRELFRVCDGRQNASCASTSASFLSCSAGAFLW